MNLIETITGFRELLKTYDVYDATVLLTSASHVPENAAVEIEHSDDHYTVTVYRHHAYSAEVMAARSATIAWNNAFCSIPVTQFNITGWTPEKLAEMQEKMRIRQEAYKANQAKQKELSLAYLKALNKQREAICQGY
jgi:hypothetical protein